MKMQKTAMLIAVITRAVAHFSLRIVFCVSEMMEIRLMIICMSSWISKTQKNRMKNKAGTLDVKSGQMSNSLDKISGNHGKAVELTLRVPPRRRRGFPESKWQRSQESRPISYKCRSFGVGSCSS